MKAINLENQKFGYLTARSLLIKKDITNAYVFVV
jgi:hypothetical protein